MGSTPQNTRNWWETRFAGIVLILACSVPLLWPAVPPFGDLPGHMARYHIALNLDNSTDLQRYYGYRWRPIGNLGVDLLMLPLGSFLGIEAATKLIVLCIPMLIAAGFLLIARAIHGRLPATAPIALVFAYPYPLHYGFVNYCLASALAFIAFWLWLALGDRKPILRAAVFPAIGLVIWLAHAVGWVILAVLCGSHELHRRRDRGESWGRSLAMTAVTCLPIGAPLVAIILLPGGDGHAVAGWLDPKALAKWAVALNRDRWIVADLATTGVVLTVIALGLSRRFGFTMAPALAWPAFALGCLYLFSPQMIDGSDFISARIVPWAAAFAILSVRTDGLTPRLRKLAAAFAIGLIMVRLAATTASLAIYDSDNREQLVALDHVPRGSAVAVLAVNNCVTRVSNWASTRRQQLGGLLVVRRDAFVNSLWDTGTLQLLEIHYEAAKPFDHSPSEVVALSRCPDPRFVTLDDAIDRLPRRTFQYVWLIDVPPSRRPDLPWLRPVYATSQSALYKIAR